LLGDGASSHNGAGLAASNAMAEKTMASFKISDVTVARLRSLYPIRVERALAGGPMIRALFMTGLVLVANSPAIAADTSVAPPQVTGTVTYRERIALPPNSLIRIQLQDVTRQDAPAVIVAEATMLTGTAQVPFAFSLAYAPSSIDQSRRYAVRASIAVEGATSFTSASVQPVLTNGAPARVDLVLVAAGMSQDASPPTATLEGTYWKLVELGGAPPAMLADVQEAHIQFDRAQKRVAAIGGCNRLMGSYVMHGTALTISAGGMTMMACPDPLGKQELAFTDALRATTGFRITGNRLELLGGNNVVARFIAAGS
jgi:putative lipoprotein